ncbi:MAG: calcineurin-like phosphoesterase C-terminal domain-containing protein [Lunatimonas sp.]|uniref:calcineurin-like phosphoesterase C-terminal domain-containing protein n=1 Tax=Lunatimonas sp. TaxID=2060141 RepID=UPI00263BBBF1|nr:calcineurin-like phosphoesterase C-terminal domain-containing protein [Lunatimonas sp.]MCC5937306.1 calcineurin-like phosphoesterase C-terminal domain-containing protein [Lunatimonas sp.]
MQINCFSAILMLAGFALPGLAQDTAKGYVYHDLNGNGIREANEPGISGVLISNGERVVRSDDQGFYELSLQATGELFAIKPSGYAVPHNADKLPQYYYWHMPSGSPSTEVPGVAASGPLPQEVNFALVQQEESDSFQVLLFGDPQARGLKEVNYVSHDVVEECIGTDAAFGITLGDIVADDSALFTEVSQSIAQIGIPWYYVFGNHDHNRDVTNDEDRDGTFKRVFGPSTYAFEYGKAVFVVVRDIHYAEDGKYTSSFTDRQLAFVGNFLAEIPKDRLVVFIQHAPLIRTQGREAIYRVLEQFPHSLSISGHTHTMNHVFVDEEMGWQGDTPHHHFINATVSGSWWCGLKDETGIPHATMNDGAPNGYTFLHIDGSEYALRFKAARRPADYQMNIYLADDIPADKLTDSEVVVNVFSGSQRSTVEMRVSGQKEWLPMDFTPMPDPYNAWMHSLSPFLDLRLSGGERADEALGWKMDLPRNSFHIWSAKLPEGLAPGTHYLEVRTTDMFGQEWSGKRIFRVR